MISSRNPVHSALWLVGNFIAIAVIYLILSAPVLFAIQLIVYAGAIMVLFLFVVMFFMSPKARTWLRPPLRMQQFLGFLAILAFLVVLVMALMGGGAQVAFGDYISGASIDAQAVAAEEAVQASAGKDMTSLGQPVPLSRWMFTYGVLPFELMGILLLVALVGAVMVGRDARSMGKDSVEDSAPLADDDTVKEAH